MGSLSAAVAGHTGALVADLDDSLLDQGPPDGPKDTVVLRPDTAKALDAYRARGGSLVINTGRRRSDLRPVLRPVLQRDGRIALRVRPGEEPAALVPELTRRASAVVMEMGAVVWFPDSDRLLRLPAGEPQPVWDARIGGLRDALLARGVPGEVLWAGDRVLSTKARYRGEVVEALRELGLEAVMAPVLNNPDADLRNPNAPLNICPLGVTKEVGMRVALGALGLSAREATGFGNSFDSDWPFLRACGTAVCPANADMRLKSHVAAVTRGERGRGGTEVLSALTRELARQGRGLERGVA